MKRMMVLLGALCASFVVFSADTVGLVRREPLANSRMTFETTGRGRVAFLGGSITQMAGWRVKVMEELQKRFPKTKFDFVCAGLSSTCSDTGAYRLGEHVYAKGTPDLIFVEYAVNDSGDGYYLEGRHDPATYDRHALRGVEGVIRGIRNRDRRTDIVMTFFTTGEQMDELRAGRTPKTYAIDGQVARRYNVTTVSVGEALAAAEKAGGFDWRRYGADCHPKADGCDFIFGLYQRLFDAEWKPDVPVAPNRRSIPIPPPIDPFNYSLAFFLGFDKVAPGDGWKVSPVNWASVPGNCRADYRAGDLLVSDKVGATCSFAFKGTAVGAFVLAGPDTGSLEVSIDGGEFAKYEMFSPYSAGQQGLHYPFVETFADELPYARHKVVLRVGESRNAGSKGNWVRIYRLCVNGTDVSGKIPAQHLTVPRAYTNVAGKVLLYRWAEPKKIDPAKKYPLVVLFHGAGERGSDNEAQLVHGATDLLNYMDAKGIEAYFIAGQCPAGRQWVDTPWSDTSHTMPAVPSEPMALAMELIDKVRREPMVDSDQVLVTGISMGGYGTWDIVQRHPDWFAAAMPCCGGGDTNQAARIKDVPIWTFHGDKDGAVPVCRSRDMVAALKAVGGNIRYREYPNAGHGVWGPTYANWDEVLSWFFAQRKTSSGSPQDEATEAWTKWREVTDARIAAIRATPNLTPPAGADIYYLSPSGDDARDGRSPQNAWRTVQHLNRQKGIRPGSYVLFERGGLWRVTLDLPNWPTEKPFAGYDGGLKGLPGVTYSAYGEGPKPRLTTSPFDGADATRWQETDAPGIWAASLGRTDVGNVVFDGGAAHGIKILPVYHKDGSTTAQYTKLPFRDYRDLTGDLHFYHDYATNGIGRGTGFLYLRSKENPGLRFKSIEFGLRFNIITSHGRNNVVYDNLCLLYGGAHGIHHGGANDLTVRNCEFGWIGGGIQGEGLFGRAWGVRYGNAVETGACDGYTITNCYVYQVYDAGLTHQADAVSRFSGKENVRYQKRIRYVGNVIEKCNYSIEYFLGRCPETNPSRMEDYLIADNLMWDAGKGLCEQRPDLSQDAHVKSWESSNRATGYVIRGNVFAGAHRQLVQVCSGLLNPDGSPSLPRLENNVFLAPKTVLFGAVSQFAKGKRPDYWPMTPETESKVNALGAGNRVYVLP